MSEGETSGRSGLEGGRTEPEDPDRSLRFRLRQQEILAELGAYALSSADLGALLQEATRLVALGLCTPFAKVMEYRPEEDQLLVRAGVGWREGIVGQYRTGADLASPTGYAFRTGEPIISGHLSADGRFRTPAMLTEHGIRRAMNVVIRTDGEPWGVVEADSPNLDDFAQDDLAFVKAVANLLGLAVGRLRTEASLGNSLARTSEILESISDAFYAVDHDWRFTYVNRRAEELWGRKRDELIGKVCWEEFPQAVGSEAHAAHLRAARERRVVQIETLSPVVHHWLDVSIYPSERGLSVYFRDVSGRRAAEQAVRESEARFRALVDASAAAVWTTDAQGMAREDSPSWRMLTGQSREDLLGGRWLDALHPQDRARVAAAWADAVDKGSSLETELRLRHASGEWRLTSVRAVPVRNPDGSLREWVGMNIDITEQRRAEEARRASDERHRLAVRATNDAVWDWDLQAGRVEWNEALGNAFGHQLAGGVSSGDWWLQHIHPEDRERIRCSIHEVIDGAASRWSDEYRFLRADGSYADVLDRGFMVRGPGGEPLRIIGAMLDVTERQRSERELRQINEHLEAEVARRTEQLHQHEEALRQSQKLEAVGQLTGGVAHDFNNLLTIIRSSADLLRRPNLSAERQQRYVEAISDTANRAAKLTGQLLAFARRQPLKPEVFLVGERVQAVTDLIRPLVGARIAIETSIECEGCAVEADPNQFETALVNLAVNARDAMEDGGRIALRTWLASELPPTRGHAGTRGEFVAASVSDGGTGIEPELLGRIFEPFFTTKEVGKGTGLGLSQVYGFAKQSGGELLVESEVGRGTTFTLYLPRVAARPDRERRNQATETGRPEAGRRNVLLVEDNTQVGEFARQLLDDLGYAATWAPNAQAALGILERDADCFDTVFSDVVMPGMNGVELGHEIRRRWPNLRVVLTSGYSHVLAKGGARDFHLLNKPYSVEGLSKALRSGQ
ncbi:PAS domain S-box protein [Roseomonas sp. KE2513]|uniref:PAS domain S-box protein n=1 Tax=Roseomonas sp. KE2513 TaxID=2479202 RepID=UPI0018DFDB9A|nr:PAS domain S-box protein [Roseomonas sp. KE2513]MBI0537675.1 PAS domain S-box protein [Roseomonas sp. KE2513]